MKDFFKGISEIKELVGQLTEDIQKLQNNSAKLDDELKKAEKVKTSIERKVKEFQTSAQPKLDKINEIIDKHTNEKNSED